MTIRLNISDDPNIYTIMDFLFVTEEHTAEDYYEADQSGGDSVSYGLLCAAKG